MHGGVESLIDQHLPNGLLGDLALDSLLLQIADQAGRPAATGGPRRGVVLGKATVIQGAFGLKAIEGGSDGGGRVLSLTQAPSEIEPRMWAQRFQAQPRAVGRLGIGKLGKPRESGWRYFGADDESERSKGLLGEGGKAPPIHFQEPIPWS